nr:helix-turn-helix domain-containing protein [uncultured Dyadobacter sp.]
MQIEIKNKLNENELFRIKRMKEVIKATRSHGHKDYLEIIYLTQGDGLHQIDHSRFPVQPASLYLVMPGQIHNWELTAVPKGFVAMIRKDFLLDHPLYDLLFHTFPVVFPSGFQLGHIDQTIAGIFESIEAEYHGMQTNFQAVIQTYLLLLFNLLRREIKSDQTQPYPQILTEFFTLLDQHYKASHEVNWFANALGMSAKTLNAACRKALDKTAGAIITERLTAESKRLLLYSDQNLGEIAFELGFSDSSHFNKFFKRQTGVLPGIYRKGIS